jgi:hypothetical protein
MQALSIHEFIVFHIPARLHQERESIEGRLRVTNHRILFDTDMDGSRSMKLVAIDIQISALSGISKRNTYLICPNGILLTLHSGESYKFVLWQRDRLIDYLYRRIRSMNRQTAHQ